MVGVTDWGLKTCQKVQAEYSEESWGGLKDRFFHLAREVIPRRLKLDVYKGYKIN
jgi:hypothetical protein